MAPLIALLLALSGGLRPAHAQDYTIDLSTLDPEALLQTANDVLMRAPDAQIDALFQATHAAISVPADAKRLCRLFDPHADRSYAALANTANQLSAGSRQRFGEALADIATTGLQSPRQPFDANAALQAIKSAGVTAAILHDGFVLGMTADGRDAASQQARCRSFGWMLDALSDLPPSQRAQATRRMLLEGMTQLGTAR